MDGVGGRGDSTGKDGAWGIVLDRKNKPTDIGSKSIVTFSALLSQNLTIGPHSLVNYFIHSFIQPLFNHHLEGD